ncbi:MAG: S41 family peptidase, partial [bacterium]|nr:S41 family peptidase [bacterium]
HSAYLTKEEMDELQRQMSGELQGIGTEVALTEDKAVGVVRVMPNSPAEKAGVQDGDRIIAIVNGDEYTLISALADIGEAVKKIRGKPGTSVTLKILRGEKDEPVTVTIVRAAITVEMVKTEILTVPNDPNTKYAYVKLVQFGEALREKMVNATLDILGKNKDVKGIIFDVRSNPGGLLGEVYEAVDALADSPDALVSIRDNSGIHAYGTALNSQPGDITGGLPMAVLVDGRSASASEIFAGALKELDRAVIIGKGTWRKGSVQGFANTGNGSYAKTTQAEYLIGSPTRWVAVQCVGVEPDIAYEAQVAWKPKKEIHECDLPGAIVSGGARSAGNPAKAPLAERDPARYGMGEQMLEAVKAFDQKAFTKSEQLRKQLKLQEPKDDPEEK